MKLRGVKVALFKHATLTTLQAAVNAYTQGLAVSNTNSGTVTYAAGEVGEREMVGTPQYWHDGTAGHVALWYKEPGP